MPGSCRIQVACIGTHASSRSHDELQTYFCSAQVTCTLTRTSPRAHTTCVVPPYAGGSALWGRTCREVRVAAAAETAGTVHVCSRDQLLHAEPIHAHLLQSVAARVAAKQWRRVTLHEREHIVAFPMAIELCARKQLTKTKTFQLPHAQLLQSVAARVATKQYVAPRHPS